MAARNPAMRSSLKPPPSQYDSQGADKLPSATLKRHPKMDLNKNDLLRLLSYLEGELQARDITIAALKAEKAKQLLYQAKYGRFGLGDPFQAMQRDTDHHGDTSFDESAVKAMYDNQLVQLENLIATQRKAQQRMREQLAAVEKRYHKVCAELEDFKQKHAFDTAQGDDVAYMLEADRERLKQQLERETSECRRLEAENQRLSGSLREEGEMSARHQQVALMLIKERKHYMEKLLVLQHQNAALDGALRDDQSKMKTVVEGLAQESHKSLLMEAALEKQLSEFDTEREQLKRRLAREEGRNRDLTQQVDELRGRLELTATSPRQGAGGLPPSAKGVLGPSPSPRVSSAGPASPRRVSGPSSPRSVRAARAPDEGDAERLGDTPVGDGRLAVVHVDSSAAQRDSSYPQVVPASPATPHSPKHSSPSHGASPADKLLAGPRFSGSLLDRASPPPSGSGTSTVFTTPSGTRISLNVGPSVLSGTPQRKAAGVTRGASPSLTAGGRGVPPPLPPNKPQVYIPSLGGAPVSSPGARSRDALVRAGQFGGGNRLIVNPANPLTTSSNTAPHPLETSQQQQAQCTTTTLHKLGMAFSPLPQTSTQDPVTISNLPRN